MHVGVANPWCRGKRSRHSRRMRNPQFYVTGKRPIAYSLELIQSCTKPSMYSQQYQTYKTWTTSIFLRCTVCLPILHSATITLGDGQFRGTVHRVKVLNTTMTAGSMTLEPEQATIMQDWEGYQLGEGVLRVQPSEAALGAPTTGTEIHDDVIKWEHLPRYWPFVRGIHHLPVNSPQKGQWRRALMFSLICPWINDWVNNREAGDLRPP